MGIDANGNVTADTYTYGGPTSYGFDPSGLNYGNTGTDANGISLAFDYANQANNKKAPFTLGSPGFDAGNSGILTAEDILNYGGGDTNGFSTDNLLQGAEVGVDLVSSIFNYGLASDQLDFNKEQAAINNAFAKTNLANQANITNADLTARQNTRNQSARNSSAKTVVPTAEYIEKFGVSGSIN